MKKIDASSSETCMFEEELSEIADQLKVNINGIYSVVVEHKGEYNIRTGGKAGITDRNDKEQKGYSG